MLKTLKNRSKKNECTSQHTDVQNHAYTNKSRRAYVRNVRQLSNPETIPYFLLLIKKRRTANAHH